MSIVVYYLQHESATEAAQHEAGVSVFTPHCKSYNDKELSLALAECERLRKLEGVSHVTLSSEMSDMVGKAGVTAIIDGKTPDGHVYDWSKAGRAGKMRRSEIHTPIERKDGNTR